MARTAGSEVSPWWEVDLQGNYSISRMRVTLDADTEKNVSQLAVTFNSHSTMLPRIVSVQDMANWLLEPEITECSVIRITAILYNGSFGVAEVNIFPGESHCTYVAYFSISMSDFQVLDTLSQPMKM